MVAQSAQPVEPLAFPREERAAQVHENLRPTLRHEITETRIETRAVVEKVIEREVEKTKIVSGGPPLEPAARGVHTEMAAVRAPGVVARQERVVEPAESRVAPQRTEPSKAAPIVERRIPSSQAAIQSLIRPAPRLATVSPVRREEPQAAAPDIHITIGRIDIRALPSSARLEGASRRSGPKLDLENYLRSRAGGRA